MHTIFNRELCIAVTNLSQGCVEYCHPKTTPDMPVTTAVRMSLSVPGKTQLRAILYECYNYMLYATCYEVHLVDFIM